MLKSRDKKPTPQELYRAKKQREEEEKEAYLPPGLINHGNTCFMNSTLQGLIATPLLYELLLRGKLSPHQQRLSGGLINSKRSPLLMNGHGLGGDHEAGWVQGMTLGDIFVATMQRAWSMQDAQKRESMSPRRILEVISTKYDQYLDFQQQDAHEFLRHLLDAMRMEELDIIKTRQPPPPKVKKRKRRQEPQSASASSSATASASTAMPAPPVSLPPELSSEDKLESFVDMLFGGRLASILVCEKCKKVSLTYEDFNDLSLSIKAEDYVKERKRDRLKNLAKKLRLRPREAEVTAVALHRSSSVPVSPSRRSADVALPDDEPPVIQDPRRRSCDQLPGSKSSEEETKSSVKAAATVTTSNPDSTELLTTAASDAATSEVYEDISAKPSPQISSTEPDALPSHKSDSDEKREKDKDAWGKLGRRISVSMKKARSSTKRHSRPKERRSKRATIDSIQEGYPSSEIPPVPILTPRPVDDSGSEMGEVSEVSKSRGISPSPSPLATPPLNASPSLSALRQEPHDFTPSIKRPKSPRPPKPTRQESNYLRRLLADVHPATPSAFALLHQAISGASGSGSSPPISAQALLSKMGHLSGIEECLRMFTAVEVMDGENMVGCHRCWKIANGTYKPRHREPEDQEEESSEAESPTTPEEPTLPPSRVEEVAMDSSASSPELTHSTPSSIFQTDAASTSSAPTTLQSTASISNRTRPPPLSLGNIQSVSTPIPKQPSAVHAAIYAGQPIPSISTTAPESPVTQTTFHVSETQVIEGQLAGPSDESLLTPRVKRTSQKIVRALSGMFEDSDTSDDSDFDDTASDRSGSVSAYSDASSLASPPVSPIISRQASAEKLASAETTKSVRSDTGRIQHEQKRKMAKRIPKSQQVILRRTYKRYLIADPPPILVIHLKRFQQTAKHHTVPFTGGFKKLDDYVIFPEYLDLSPFLAPKKEDFGLGQSKPKDKNKAQNGKKEGRCMYRLYSVVVHIGNMLGGHYVAYTALRSPRPSEDPLAPSTKADMESSTASDTLKSESDNDTTAQSPRQPRQWAYISDTVVRLTTIEEVLKAKAYICMYERI